jgi:hypothetical protein
MLDETDGPDPVRDDDDGLLSRLRLIEERPLEERADAYARIHTELVAALEGEDGPHESRDTAWTG